LSTEILVAMAHSRTSKNIPLTLDWLTPVPQVP
jgi:hypothetical protein